LLLRITVEQEKEIMMKRFAIRAFGISVIGVLAILFAWNAGCTLPKSPVTPDESIESLAWKRIRAGAMLVDVRTPEEYSQGHLQDSVNIPYDQLAARVNEIDQDKDRDIVVYCRSGRRSSLAKRTLESLGYTNVLNAGGYEPMLKAK
jgi:phage shock protein E